MHVITPYFGFFPELNNFELVTLIVFLYVLPAIIVLGLLVSFVVAVVRVHDARVRGDSQSANSITKRVVGAVLLVLVGAAASIILPVLISG
jgi:uncharacterized membrane protein